MQKNKKIKKLLRDEMRFMTEKFSKNKDDVLTASIKTAELVTNDARYLDADTLLTFMSLPNEIQTAMIIEQALKDGKKVAVPKTLNKKNISFYYIDPNIPLYEQMKKGKNLIFEPLENAKEFELTNTGKQIFVLVPGLAFSSTGDRLGYGMGFYDRFLQKLLAEYSTETDANAPPSIDNMPFIAGICYSFQVLPSIPIEITDIPVDSVFTERNKVTS